MKKAFSILLIVTLVLKALPALQYFSGDTGQYTLVHDDNPEFGKTKEKKEGEKFISLMTLPNSLAPTGHLNFALHIAKLPSPFSDIQTPPPDPAGKALA